MRTKKLLYIALSVILVIVLSIIYFTPKTSAGTNTGYHWNQVKYTNGFPECSIVFNNLDSVNSSLSDYDDGVIRTFDKNTITMGWIYKAPITDTVRIITVAKSYNDIIGTTSMTYNVDTQIALGASSYTYRSHSVTFSFSGYGAQYAVYIENAKDSSHNRKNDTLAVTYTPSEMNYVPGMDFYRR